MYFQENVADYEQMLLGGSASAVVHLMLGGTLKGLDKLDYIGPVSAPLRVGSWARADHMAIAWAADSAATARYLHEVKQRAPEYNGAPSGSRAPHGTGVSTGPPPTGGAALARYNDAVRRNAEENDAWRDRRTQNRRRISVLLQGDDAGLRYAESHAERIMSDPIVWEATMALADRLSEGSLNEKQVRTELYEHPLHRAADAARARLAVPGPFRYAREEARADRAPGTEAALPLQAALSEAARRGGATGPPPVTEAPAAGTAEGAGDRRADGAAALRDRMRGRVQRATDGRGSGR
jgi:hypothetical protein